MRIINRDLTKEKITVYVTNHQIYIEIFVKYHGKWVKETYFQSYDWEIDQEYVNGTVKYIMHTWNLKNPVVRIIK